MRTTRIEHLFATEQRRLSYLGIEAAGLYVDLSKHRIDKAVLTTLLDLAEARHLGEAIEDMFAGSAVNTTERRPALHTLLRHPVEHQPEKQHLERFSDVRTVRRRLSTDSERIRNGQISGYSGRRIRDVVNIGIGGSHLGPQLACRALGIPNKQPVSVHFLSNVDGGAITQLLNTLDPEKTLFIVASKSFTTAETLRNARSAASWLQDHFRAPAANAKHFFAITAQTERAQDFGVAPENIYPMWDWVGGRYSLWSAIGLPIAIAIGAERFERLLVGAHHMDRHFRNTEFARNIPVLQALIGIWNNNFLGNSSLAVVPYDERLYHFPAYLQQLEMESNGKRVSHANTLVDYATAPVIWGGVGTNAQHAFFQQLHQGTAEFVIDFIVALTHEYAALGHHDMLFANCIAQAEALMRGRDTRDSPGSTTARSSAPIDLHRACPGDRASTIITMDTLEPETLGALIALYEHKTYVQGVIWNINSFDQWGVEIGKQLADTVQSDITGDKGTSHDPSTQAMIERFRRLKQPG